MPSPYSMFLARWVFAPATLTWCMLTLDRQRPDVVRAWLGQFRPLGWPGPWAGDFARRPERPAAHTGADASRVARPSEITDAQPEWPDD